MTDYDADERCEAIDVLRAELDDLQAAHDEIRVALIAMAKARSEQYPRGDEIQTEHGPIDSNAFMHLCCEDSPCELCERASEAEHTVHQLAHRLFAESQK